MKQTVVPAQVTTVEDKIAGNISFKQLLLLVTPVFFGGAMYVLLPPFMGYSLYKALLWITFSILCLSMAIRIKGLLVIEWLIIRGRYNLRPSTYIYDKNVAHFRSQPAEIVMVNEEANSVDKSSIAVEDIDDGRLRKLHSLVTEPKSDVEFRATKKGGLRVYIKEV